MLSYWEQQSLITYDYLIMGGGIVGMCTAIYLKQQCPDASVLVLERGLLPSGASTRNAGFACMGSASELLDDLQHSKAEEVFELFHFRRMGLERLRTLCGDRNIGYAEKGSHELLFKPNDVTADQLDFLNKQLKPVLGKDAFVLVNERIANYGFRGVYALIENVCEGELHTGKLIRRLIDLCIGYGIEIKTGAHVTRLEPESKGYRVHCLGLQGYELGFFTHKVALCTNAFSRSFLPEVDLQPGRGQVLITKPIENIPFQGIFHFEKGYYYFRQLDQRILIGGGRNHDFNTEQTTEFGLNEEIQQLLKEKLYECILPGRAVEVDMQWSGIMAFGSGKQPVLKKIDEHLFAGIRMGGMGVAIGAEIGCKLAGMLCEK
ncbi:MAG TPA: FAD-dependent oxidoreductase [Chitinophagaceae bacterium]|nr:FAD-dependent oxidoreductase [Chitinophagaceae bacterium]HNF71549.1 FAD-dependent oxidoreductase [Chitinophagaceae bacterium]